MEIIKSQNTSKLFTPVVKMQSIEIGLYNAVISKAIQNAS